MRCKVLILNIILIGVMLITFTLVANAKSVFDDNFYDEMINQITEKTDDDVINMLSDLGFNDYSPEEISNISLSDVINTVIRVFKGSLKQPLSFLCVVTGILILSAFTHNLIAARNSANTYFETVCIIFVSLLSLSEVINCVSDSVAAVYSIGFFMKLIIPVLAAIAAFTGNPTMAIGSQSVAIYVSEVIIAVCDDFLTPILCLFSSVAVCVSINSNINISPLINLIKKIFNTVLGLLGTIYSGVLTIKNVLTASIDKISVKGIKFLLGSTVPVVGGTLSEGLNTAIASVALFKNTYGIIGIIVVILVVLPVCSELLLWILSLMTAEYLASALAQDRMSEVFSSLKYVLTMLITLIMFTAFILLISVATVLILSKN